MKFWQVDSFTDTLFKGNPAAVCVTEKPLDDALMQSIAKEMNLSETAYVLLRGNNPPLLRWFTTSYEMDLCGHATLASAHVLFKHFLPHATQITFDTLQAGQLTVDKDINGYKMNFPSRPGKQISLSDVPKSILQSLSETLPSEVYLSRDMMLVYDNPQVILDMNPSFFQPQEGLYVIVTSRSHLPEYDFISRFFSPSDNIPEDPVTGSAHCTLTPYWAKKLDKQKMHAYQASERTGELIVELSNDRVYLTGKVKDVLSGEIHL